jgi:hypothetical protein
MLERHFTGLLYVTGAITLTPLLQYLLPTWHLQLSGLHVGDETGLLFARHWGLMAACFGGLLILAARDPGVRRPIVIAALVEKLGLVWLVGQGWSVPALAGLHLAAVFDGLCVLLYAAWLLGAGRVAPTRR